MATGHRLLDIPPGKLNPARSAMTRIGRNACYTDLVVNGSRNDATCVPCPDSSASR